MRKVLLFIVLFVFVFNTGSLLAQEGPWNNTIGSFIQNKGQFDGRNWQSKTEIEYGIDYGGLRVFFTKEGLTYRFDKFIKNPLRDNNPELPKKTNISELILVHWVGANDDVRIEAYDEIDQYYSYAIREYSGGETKNVNFIPGYKKIVYRNLYDNIDVEFTYHDGVGIKYNFILHPGADISQVQFKYSAAHTNIAEESISISLNSAEELEMKTSLGEITELTPIAYYQGNENDKISVKFRFENNILSFDMGSFDHNRTVVIDPWVISPTFNTSNAVWEVETDQNGNIYCIGGETPMLLQKYNSAGAWQWTYTTPWDTAGYWLGTLATDDNGNSFITAGTSPEIERISNTGAMVWHNTGYNTVCEYWSITFNCDKTRLIVGGTYVPWILSFDYSSAIFDIDINTGAALGYQTFDTTNIAGFGVFPVEVRSIAASKNAKYVFLTHDDCGQIIQNIGSCPSSTPLFEVPNGHELGYKCEDYLPETQNGGGLKAIIANDDYFYTHSGDQIHKRSLFDGSLITSAVIPSGSNHTVPLVGGIVVENCGLDVDSCGNVYAGSNGLVVKYDEDLNFISSAAIGFTAYDVSVNTNGEVVAVGAVNDNGSVSRDGKIQSVNLNACYIYTPSCCDATICPMTPICHNEPAFDLTANSPGGTWSGTGITNTTNGTFDPSVTGPGQYWVYYTLPCGTDSVLLTVNFCDSLIICQQPNGDLMVSGGVAPYEWQDTTITEDCSGCFMGICNIPPGCVVYDTTWNTFATGNTIPYPTGFPVQVIDNGGNSTIIYSTTVFPACSSTPLVADAGNDQYMCEGGSVNIGGSPSADGGTPPYTYLWTPSAGLSSNTAANPTASPASTTQYILQVTDSLGNSDVDTVIVTVYPLPSVDLGPPVYLCTGDSTVLDAGAGMTVYSWSTGASTQTITVTTSDTYYVTVSNSYGCINTDSVVVTVSPQPTASISGDTSICDNETAMLVAGGGGLYTWSNSMTNDTIYVSPAVTTQYYVIVSVGSCVDTAYFTVTVYPSPNVDLGADQNLCEGDTTTLDAGGGFLSYFWSTTETTQTIDVISSGVYYVTVTDAGSCLGIDSVNIVFDTIPYAYILGDTAMCFGDSVVLTGYGGGAYLWSTSSTQSSITVSPGSNTTYTLTVSNGNCSATVSYDVVVHPLPTVDAGNDTTVTAGTSVQLQATGGTYYSWSPAWYLSCTDCSNPICTPDETTVYTVTVTDDYGCTNFDDVIVYVEYDCGDIFVPTAFAPNGNNYNDYFRILGGCFTTFNLQVFDRWGNKVYESNEQSEGWDGTYKGEPLDGGIYYYIYSGMRIDGETDAGNGDVTLIR